MKNRQRIYATVLGLLSAGILAGWSVQAFYLSSGTYTNPLTDGWMLFIYLSVSPVATGFAIAVNKSDNLLFSISRMVVISQIPLFALLLCASTVAAAVVLQTLAVAMTMLAAICGLLVCGRSWYETGFYGPED